MGACATRHEPPAPLAAVCAQRESLGSAADESRWRLVRDADRGESWRREQRRNGAAMRIPSQSILTITRALAADTVDRYAREVIGAVRGVCAPKIADR